MLCRFSFHTWKLAVNLFFLFLFSAVSFFPCFTNAVVKTLCFGQTRKENFWELLWFNEFICLNRLWILMCGLFLRRGIRMMYQLAMSCALPVKCPKILPTSNRSLECSLLLVNNMLIILAWKWFWLLFYLGLSCLWWGSPLMWKCQMLKSMECRREQK